MNEFFFVFASILLYRKKILNMLTHYKKIKKNLNQTQNGEVEKKES